MRAHIGKGTGALAAVILLAFLAAGAGPGPRQVAKLESPPSAERRIVDVRWDTVLAVGSLRDTLLSRPRLLAAHEGKVYVYDYLAHQVVAMEPPGEVVWTLGREGAGPAEFRGPMDLEVGPEGRVWINDPSNRRLMVVSPSGEVERLIPIEAVEARDVVPLGRRVLLGVFSREDLLWVELGGRGEVIGRGGLPVAAMAAIDPYVRQSFLSQDGNTWAAIFPWGDPFFVYRDTSLHCRGRLVEGRPLSEARGQESPVWAVQVDVDGDAVFTLARGESEDALQLIDEYSTGDCTYRRSYRLPGRVQAMQAEDGVFYVSSEDPYPRVLGLRPVPLEKNGE